MPHLIVKMHPAEPEAHKQRIAEEATKAIMAVTGHGADGVSVGVEEIQPGDWAEGVYRPDILGTPATLYKKPGYDSL